MTIAAVVLSIGAGGMIYCCSQAIWVFLIVPIVLFIRMALNAVDGMLAREHAMKSALGTFLNELGDIISDAALYLPFVVVAGVRGELIVLIVVAAAISEMAGILGGTVGASRRYDGPMGKSDRAFAFGVISILIGFGVAVGLWLNVLLVIIFALIIVNTMVRVSKALSEVG